VVSSDTIPLVKHVLQFKLKPSRMNEEIIKAKLSLLDGKAGGYHLSVFCQEMTSYHQSIIEHQWRICAYIKFYP
jgi:hypothetical protein